MALAYFYKCSFAFPVILKKIMISRKSLLFLLLLCFLGLMAQSCKTAKGCGCGTDLNRAYKPKHFR